MKTRSTPNFIDTFELMYSMFDEKNKEYLSKMTKCKTVHVTVRNKMLKLHPVMPFPFRSNNEMSNISYFWRTSYTKV